MDTIAGLLDTDSEQMVNAMCYRVVATHHEVMHKRHTAEIAAYGKDALAKVKCSVCACVRACVCVLRTHVCTCKYVCCVCACMCFIEYVI